jgi:tyrosyl-tRNA synthetase
MQQSNTATGTATMERRGGAPVDNLTYDLLQTLTSKLEAIEAYGKYLSDADGDTRQLFESFRDQDRQAVQQILQILPGKLGGRQGPMEGKAR